MATGVGDWGRGALLPTTIDLDWLAEIAGLPTGDVVVTREIRALEQRLTTWATAEVECAPWGAPLSWSQMTLEEREAWIAEWRWRQRPLPLPPKRPERPDDEQRLIAARVQSGVRRDAERARERQEKEDDLAFRAYVDGRAAGRSHEACLTDAWWYSDARRAVWERLIGAERLATIVEAENARRKAAHTDYLVGGAGRS